MGYRVTTTLESGYPISHIVYRKIGVFKNCNKIVTIFVKNTQKVVKHIVYFIVLK